MNPDPIYFIIGLLAFLLGFGSFIAWVAGKLNHNISQRAFGLIEKTIIAGILLGIVGMFQPWALPAYGIGFHVLLIFTLAYVVWSHVTPKAEAVVEAPSAEQS
jgi:hypothetical protein